MQSEVHGGKPTWFYKNNRISLQASDECLAEFKKLSLMKEWSGLEGKERICFMDSLEIL